nr:hypothetical protein Iba_chr07aCG13070 [Ipomoea batatas]
MKSSSISHLARGMENLASGTEEAPLRSRGDLLSVVLDGETLGFVTSIFKSWLDPPTSTGNLVEQCNSRVYYSRLHLRVYYSAVCDSARLRRN